MSWGILATRRRKRSGYVNCRVNHFFNVPPSVWKNRLWSYFLNWDAVPGVLVTLSKRPKQPLECLTDIGSNGFAFHHREEIALTSIVFDRSLEPSGFNDLATRYCQAMQSGLLITNALFFIMQQLISGVAAEIEPAVKGSTVTFVPMIEEPETTKKNQKP